MYNDKKASDFLTEDFADAIHLWNRASISLLDIRHHLISRQEAVCGYIMPANTFLYTSGGKAEVCLDKHSYAIERFGVFHGRKGTELSISPDCDWLEYYLILYKAGEPAFHRGEFSRLMKKRNPFEQQYGFVPANPLFFSEELRKMYEKWKGPTALNLFYGKVAFYRFVYEIYEEIAQRSIQIFEPDVIAMAKRYMDENYSQAIAIQEICEMFGISYSHFHRKFKQQNGKSPQEYLIYIRLAEAKDLLQNSEASIRQIADYCGFQDERNLQRMFSKHLGFPPNAYRENRSLQKRDDDLGNTKTFAYNEKSQVSYVKLKGEGERLIMQNFKSKTILAAALSFVLLLSACAPAADNSSTTKTEASSAVSSQVSEKEAAEPAEAETKIISTVKGDVEIPTNPQRVIVHYLAGDAVALGVIPIAVSEVLPGSVFQDELKDSAQLGQWDFDLEEVMSLEPDLIVSVNEEQYEELSKIAPTVLVPYGTMTTEERVAFMGEIFSKPNEAKAALKKYDDAIADGKAKLAEAEFGEATVSAMQVSDSSIAVAGDKHALGVILYKELGIKAPEIVQTSIIDAGEYWGGPSMEVLSDYCGDYIFHLGEVPESIAANAVWQSIPAVSAGKVLIMDTAITYYTDISSSTAMVNNVVEQLLNAKG
ncbi:AraC family transcriptional regulator [Scatolibacter rhodanostii]|uniref:AraC family transcriptional regulator n=1 Tax=Scatolibacter rhodanostii TaxID=2014781 RepID=UPI000C07DA3D|nr:AraC family transcriptional regulator [Scatolibacter rhodanostii]